MKQLPFGLDIGANTLKAIWLSQDKNGYFLNGFSILPTPKKGMVSDSPLDLEEMSNAIRSLVSEAKITTPHVNLALPENDVYTRVLEMPPLSDKELSSAIYWEAEQCIPVPLTSVMIDWKVLKRPKEDQNSKMRVLLVGAPTALVEKYQKVIDMAGLNAASMETEILAVSRSIVYPNDAQAPFPNSLIIHIGSLSTLLTIIKDGMIIFTYFIPIGGMAINRAIAADFGFTLTQAEEYKKVYGYSSKMFGGKIGKSAEPVLQSILTEVKKALTFFNEKYKSEAVVNQIILSGGTAKLPGLDMFFAQNSGIETVIANPWKIISNQQIPDEILNDAPDFSVSMGLAMKDYE